MSTEHCQIACVARGLHADRQRLDQRLLRQRPQGLEARAVDNDMITLGKTNFKFKSINCSVSTGALIAHHRSAAPSSCCVVIVARREEEQPAEGQKVCGGCRRVMLPVWTKCLFCGWAPVARLEFILGPMANQTLPLDRGGHDDRLGRRQHRRARRSRGVAQARRRSARSTATTSSPISARRMAFT